MKTFHLSIYRTRFGHRWRMRTKNGEIIGASTQAFSRKIDCYANLNDVVGLQMRSQRQDFVRAKILLGARNLAAPQ